MQEDTGDSWILKYLSCLALLALSGILGVCLRVLSPSDVFDRLGAGTHNI